MKDSDYAYSVAYVRAIEQRLLTGGDFESLLSAKSVAEVLRMISDKGYDTSISIDNYEDVLSEAYRDAYNEILGILPKDAPLDMSISKNDFHNLKAAIKGVKLGISDFRKYTILPSAIEPGNVAEIIAHEEFDMLPEHLVSCAKEAYDILTRTGDGQLADIIIDKAYMDYSLKSARIGGNEFIIKLTLMTNIYTDIKIAARCANTSRSVTFLDMAVSDECGFVRSEFIAAAASGFDVFTDYLSDKGYEDASDALQKSMMKYEKYSSNKIDELMQDSKYITLGIEPIVAYLHAKQKEVQRLRIIISDKIREKR